MPAGAHGSACVPERERDRCLLLIFLKKIEWYFVSELFNYKKKPELVGLGDEARCSF
jgi:hypothetical protein